MTQNLQFESLPFENKTALVVGGTHGTGREISLLLKKYGAQVFATGRRCDFTESDGIQFIQLDVEKSGMESLENPLVKNVTEKCDILVYVTGPFVQKTAAETSACDWYRMALLDYALPGAFTSAVLKNQIEKKWGRILLFGGTRTESVKAFRTNCAYAGAKTGLSVLTKSVAAQYGGEGIRCNCLLPGFTHDAPEGTFEISELKLAEKGLYLLLQEELNGVLLNADYGWNP